MDRPERYVKVGTEDVSSRLLMCFASRISSPILLQQDQGGAKGNGNDAYALHRP